MFPLCSLFDARQHAQVVRRGAPLVPADMSPPCGEVVHLVGENQREFGDRLYRHYPVQGHPDSGGSKFYVPADGSAVLNSDHFGKIRPLQCGGSRSSYPAAKSYTGSKQAWKQSIHVMVADLHGIEDNSDIPTAAGAWHKHGRVIDHIDDNKLNWAVSNLQWLAIGQNVAKGNARTLALATRGVRFYEYGKYRIYL